MLCLTRSVNFANSSSSRAGMGSVLSSLSYETLHAQSGCFRCFAWLRTSPLVQHNADIPAIDSIISGWSGRANHDRSNLALIQDLARERLPTQCRYQSLYLAKLGHLLDAISPLPLSPSPKAALAFHRQDRNHAFPLGCSVYLGADSIARVWSSSTNPQSASER